jgi:hypothetical protein
MTKGHAANVQGFKLMNVLTLMLGYEATKFDRLKDEATILALTSNDSMQNSFVSSENFGHRGRRLKANCHHVFKQNTWEGLVL